MPSLNSLIRPIIRELIPDPARVQLAESRSASLIEGLDRLSDRFTVRQIRLHGSIKRGTAIAHFADIDQLVILDPTDLVTRAGHRPTPNSTIYEIGQWIERTRAGLIALGHIVLRPQTHSLGVIYPKSELRVDLVPALTARGRGGSIYEIPSRRESRWIKTNIRRIEEMAAAAPPKLIDAIRLMKGWRHARGRNKGFSLPSYALELLLLNRLAPAHNTPPLDIIRQLMTPIADAHKRRHLSLDGNETGDAITFCEPWTGENLMGKNSTAQRQALIERCRWTLDHLDKAAASSSDATATRILRSLFIGG